MDILIIAVIALHVVLAFISTLGMAEGSLSSEPVTGVRWHVYGLIAWLIPFVGSFYVLGKREKGSFKEKYCDKLPVNQNGYYCDHDHSKANSFSDGGGGGE